MILQYKLSDFIEIYDDYVNDPIKGDFSEDFVTTLHYPLPHSRIDTIGSIQLKIKVMSKFVFAKFTELEAQHC